MFKYKGHTLKANDSRNCKQTNGDCFAFLKTFVNIYFEQSNAVKERHFITNNLEPRLCTADDITELQMQKGHLSLCPPKEGLSLQNYNLIYPNRLFALKIEPKSDADPSLSINDLMIKRL